MADWLEAYGRITNLNPEERAWWETQEEAEHFVEIVLDDEDDDETGKCYLRFTDLPQDTQVGLVKKFLRLFRPSECVTITWACQSHAYRGGGACLISATTDRWNNTYYWAEEQEKKFYARMAKKGKKK